ncbi:unnamed protein product [Camellia sinensis]
MPSPSSFSLISLTSHSGPSMAMDPNPTAIQPTHKLRRLIQPSRPPIPHGSNPFFSHQPLHCLVRQPLEPKSPIHHQRLPLFPLLPRSSSLRRRLVAHNPPLHRPNRLQHHRQHHPLRRVLRLHQLPRQLPHSINHPIHHQNRRNFIPARPTSELRKRPLLSPHFFRNSRSGLLSSCLWVPLFLLPSHCGCHSTIRLGWLQWHAVSRHVRIPICVAEGFRQAAAGDQRRSNGFSEWGCGCGWDDQCDCT